MCGKLATYLRFCGYDAAYALDRGVEADDRLRALARTEDRVLLTRDRELAERTTGERTAEAVLLESRAVRDQLRELAARGFALEPAAEPSRCGECNGVLEPVASTDTTPEHAPAPHRRRVWQCVECGQHFWKGSHWDRVAGTLADL